MSTAATATFRSMSPLRLRLAKARDDSHPKGDKSGGVIHAVVSYLKNMWIAAVFTLSYILGLWIDPMTLRFYLNPKGHLYSEWEARQLFESWCKENNRTYPSEDEKLYRFGVFKNQTLECLARDVLMRKKKLPGPPGTNCFADQTVDELSYLVVDGSYSSDSD